MVRVAGRPGPDPPTSPRRYLRPSGRSGGSTPDAAGMLVRGVNNILAPVVARGDSGLDGFALRGGYHGGAGSGRAVEHADGPARRGVGLEADGVVTDDPASAGVESQLGIRGEVSGESRLPLRDRQASVRKFARLMTRAAHAPQRSRVLVPRLCSRAGSRCTVCTRLARPEHVVTTCAAAFAAGRPPDRSPCQEGAGRRRWTSSVCGKFAAKYAGEQRCSRSGGGIRRSVNPSRTVQGRLAVALHLCPDCAPGRGTPHCMHPRVVA